MRVAHPRGVIELAQGDITRQKVDAIVNAANSSLLGGGGVDGAIHRAGGPEILEECKRHRHRLGGDLPDGEAVITTAGRLDARVVIHTAGPIWHGGKHGEPGHLARCYNSALAQADAKGFQSIAFPSISTGIYGYPVEEAAGVALGVVNGFLTEASSLILVRFVLFDSRTFDAYRTELAKFQLPEAPVGRLA